MNTFIEKNTNEIVEFDDFEAQLLELEKDYGTRVYDLTDTDQETAARSDRLKVANTQSAFKKARLAAKDEAQQQVNLVNKKGRIIYDRMEAVKQHIKGQIDKRDQELEEHAEKLQAMVDEITELGIFITDDDYGTRWCPTSSQVEDRLSALKKIVVNDSYEDRQPDARRAFSDTIKKLEDMLVSVIKSEDEQSELEKLRKEKEAREQAEHDERIRTEAADKATREANLKAAKEAANKLFLAEEEKRETEKRFQAEKDKIREETIKRENDKHLELVAADKREAEEQQIRSEKERIEKNDREKQKVDEVHRGIINDRIVKSMMDHISDSFLVDDPAQLKKGMMFILNLIKEGVIDRVSIDYSGDA